MPPRLLSVCCCRPGSVYDRLTNPGSFTGVYRRAWETDGRMNAHADIASAKSFRGNTNTNSNANIHDISMYVAPSPGRGHACTT